MSIMEANFALQTRSRTRPGDLVLGGLSEPGVESSHTNHSFVRQMNTPLVAAIDRVKGNRVHLYSVHTKSKWIFWSEGVRKFKHIVVHVEFLIRVGHLLSQSDRRGKGKCNQQ